MSWWFPAHVRRIIAILLLLVDLGLEPGSALSFVGMSDPEENEAVADLCRQDDFWWGRTSAAIDEAAHVVQTNGDCGTGTPQSAAQTVSAGSITQAASTPFNLDPVLISAGGSFDLARSELGRFAFSQHSFHRNSYIAQKRDIVLIV